MHVTRVGPLMQRVCPTIQRGDNLFKHFEFNGAAAEVKSFTALAMYTRRYMVMKSLEANHSCLFRGEWILEDTQQLLCFLGWPWVRDADELINLGITLHEIPAHNPLGDLLLLLRTSHNTLADTYELSNRLRERSSGLKHASQQLEHIAHFDPLTSLPNRVLLADQLQQAMIQSRTSGKTLAIISLDVDGFKPINDLHGHFVGNQLLVLLSQRMKAALREGDILSRIGGDEFVAVLINLDKPQDCEPVLSRLLQTVAEPVIVGSLTLNVSASIGVTFFPNDNGDSDLLLRHADQAMYQAKQGGKNCYRLFDIEQDSAMATRLENIEEIRRAMIENELLLYYQPKVNMRSGEVVGVEALIRWQHPKRGLLNPGEFLPVIEGHPLIADLGEWVIKSALAQLDRWNSSGLNLSVSINIDATQMQKIDFVAQLSRYLASHPSVKQGQLEFEILESSALQDVERIVKLIHECRLLGVSFSLDDFGTGHSSLTYLKHLSVETLKIDQSFVIDMLDHPDDMAIVKGVIGLAAAFHRQVVAEGVESVAHGTLLLALGCSLAQGYHIARPMPANKIPAWIANWRPDRAWIG